MYEVAAILALFLFGILLTCLIHFCWRRSSPTTIKKSEDLLMARKVSKTIPVKARSKDILNLDYLRVYHEVLKHEDVLDIDLDQIYNATICVLQRKLTKGKLVEKPDPTDIEIIIKEVMDKLCNSQ